MSENIKIKKSTLYIFAIIIIVLAVGLFMVKSGDSLNKEAIQDNLGNNGEIQKVVIGMNNYNYYPNIVKVKAGIPVSITLDKSVYGCFRDFTIREFGIHQYLKTPEDALEFTPTKKGSYTFACSMGMGTGTLIVE